MSLKTQKKKTWQAFSKYIRHKYSNGDGTCACYTCGTVKPIGEMQAGHGLSGRTNAKLFLEEIVRPQCVACNMFKGGMYEVFVPKLIELYGLDGFNDFVRLKNTTVKYTISELEDMEKQYKEATNELLAEG